MTEQAEVLLVDVPDPVRTLLHWRLSHEVLNLCGLVCLEPDRGPSGPPVTLARCPHCEVVRRNMPTPSWTVTDD